MFYKLNSYILYGERWASSETCIESVLLSLWLRWAHPQIPAQSILAVIAASSQCSLGVFSTLGGGGGGGGGGWGSIKSTSVGYQKYIGGISWVHRRDMDVISTSGDVQHIEGIPWCMCGYHAYIGIFNINQRLLSIFSPHMKHDLCFTNWIAILAFSVLNPPPPPPPMYSWYLFNVLNIPRYTENPPMCWTSLDVLITHFTGWLSMSRSTPVIIPLSLETEFNTVRFINYTIPRFCSTFAIQSIGTFEIWYSSVLLLQCQKRG